MGDLSPKTPTKHQLITPKNSRKKSQVIPKGNPFNMGDIEQGCSFDNHVCSANNSCNRYACDVQHKRERNKYAYDVCYVYNTHYKKDNYTWGMPEVGKDPNKYKGRRNLLDEFETHQKRPHVTNKSADLNHREKKNIDVGISSRWRNF